MGPLPLADDQEELIHYHGCGSLWVELADAGNQHGPRHTSGETHNVCIDGAALGPELDGSQGLSEGASLGDQVKDLIRHTCAVQGTKLGLIQTTQKGRVLQRQVLRQLLLYYPGEDQIDADAGILEFDDGDEGVGDDGQAGDGVLGGHFDEHPREVLEIVISRNILGGDDEGIDIGSGPINTKAIAAVGEDLAYGSADEDVVLGLPNSGHVLDKLVTDGLEGVEYRFPAEKVSGRERRDALSTGAASPLCRIGWGLEGVLSLELLEKTISRPSLGIGREVDLHRRRHAVHLLGLHCRACALRETAAERRRRKTKVGWLWSDDAGTLRNECGQRPAKLIVRLPRQR